MGLQRAESLRRDTTKLLETETAGVEPSFCPLLIDTTEVSKLLFILGFWSSSVCKKPEW